MFGLRRHSQQAEFEALLAPHLDGLYGAAVRLTRQPTEAEDLVQDAVMRAFRFFDRFERGTNFKAWLYRILTNTFINGYRRQQKAKSLGEESERQSVEASFFSADVTEQVQDPEAYLVDRALSEAVLAAIDELPIDFRMVVILADLQEFSYKEVADILNVPVGTVMSRLFRGRKALQRILLAKDGIAEAVPADDEAVGLDDDASPINLNAYRQRKKLG